MQKIREFGYKNVFVDEAQNVICELNVENSDQVVVFSAHLDVVFPDLEPLPYQEDDKNIYCPGCGDDSTCVAQLLSVMKMVIDTGMKPKHNIVFALTSCEEGLGDLKGARSIMKRYGSSVEAFYSFDGDYQSVINRSLGSKRYKVTVRTTGGHAFENFGNENAARVLAKGIQLIYDIPVPEGGETTYNVGLISGGTSVNSIVQEASMLCEFRSSSYEYLYYMQKAFSKVFLAMRETANVDVEIVGDRPCMQNVDPLKQNEMSEMCAKIQYKYSGVIPTKKVGSTDCNIPHSMGIPAVCVGTYCGGGIHTREEWVDKQSVYDGVKIVADAVATYFHLGG